MTPSLQVFLIPGALVSLGVLFAWVEKNTAATRALLPPAVREFAVSRSRRRVRIAALLIFVGVLMACGNLTDPELYPLRFVTIWGLTALLAVSMLCYGIADFYFTRAQMRSRVRRQPKAHVAAQRSLGEPSNGSTAPNCRVLDSTSASSESDD